jgi:hypothetical protein
VRIAGELRDDRLALPLLIMSAAPQNVGEFGAQWDGSLLVHAVRMAQPARGRGDA